MPFKDDIVILVVDDDAYKIEDIRLIWSESNGANWSRFEIVNDIAAALRYLTKNAVDLLILDLNIPWRAGQIPSASEARRLLGEIYNHEDVIPPRCGIILSSYEEVIIKEQDFFLDKGWISLRYSTDLQDWRNTLRDRFNYLRKSHGCKLRANEVIYDYDYCILTALRTPELDPILRWNCGWQPTEGLDSTSFWTGEINVKGSVKKIVIGNAFRMGMVHSSILCAKIWHYFRPKNIIMTGIAAGVKSAVDLGDILIAEEVWDYGAGKVTEDKKGEKLFLPDPRHVNADHPLVEGLWAFGQNRMILRVIEDGWNAKKPTNVLKVHKGPVASGGTVVSNSTEIGRIVGLNRKLIGLEMEAFGIYSTCEMLPKPRPRFLCVKSVCDFADGQKNDDFQDYAAFTSSQFVKLALEAGLFEQL